MPDSNLARILPFAEDNYAPPEKETLASQARLIIRDELVAAAAAELASLSDDDLRERALADLGRPERSGQWPFNTSAMTRFDMIWLLTHDAGGWPETEVIGPEEDDPVIVAAHALRRDAREAHIAAASAPWGSAGSRPIDISQRQSGRS